MASERPKDPAQIALDAFNQAVASKQAELDAREREVVQREERMAEEVKKMSKIEAKDGDLIYLNVGGRPFVTKRSTLCVEEDTMLAAMFSGRWEDKVTKDDKGATFLDFNPDLFSILLDHLRAKQFAPPGRKITLPPVSSIPATQQDAYQVMLEFLEFAKPSQLTTGFTFAPNSKFTVTNEGKKAALASPVDGNHIYWHIVTEQKCEPGVSVWRVKLGTVGTHIFLGIEREGFTDKGVLNCREAGYVWFDHDGPTHNAFVRGKTAKIPGGQAFEAGHTVALSLSTDGVLTLQNETTGKTHTMPGVQMTDAYRFLFITNKFGALAEIVDV